MLRQVSIGQGSGKFSLCGLGISLIRPAWAMQKYRAAGRSGRQILGSVWSVEACFPLCPIWLRFSLIRNSAPGVPAIGVILRGRAGIQPPAGRSKHGPVRRVTRWGRGAGAGGGFGAVSRGAGAAQAPGRGAVEVWPGADPEAGPAGRGPMPKYRIGDKSGSNCCHEGRTVCSRARKAALRRCRRTGGMLALVAFPDRPQAGRGG